MKLAFTFYLFFLSLAVFGQKRKEIFFPPPILGMEQPEFLSACDLLNHKKELVYTRFIYSGADEYYSLKPEKKCVHINAQLDIPDSVVIRPDYLKKLKELHKNYRKKYIIIDVIGTFDDSDSSLHSRFGNNNSQFTVKYIVNLNIYSKKTNKK